MSNQDQPRVAKGTPKRGGQWSSKHTAEAAGMELTDPDGILDDWRAVSVTDPEVLGRLQDAEVLPEHFSDPDRNVRRWAAYERGDLIFEGETTGRAYELHSHVPHLPSDAVFHWTEKVDIGGSTVHWGSLSPEDQVAYIRGYAQGIAENRLRELDAVLPVMHDALKQNRAAMGRSAAKLARESFDALSDEREELRKSLGSYDAPGDAYRSGIARADRAVSAKRKIDRGGASGESLTIVDPDAHGRRLVVTDPKPDPVRGGYAAKVAAGQYRRHYDADGSGRTIPWTEGTQVFFRPEALGV